MVEVYGITPFAPWPWAVILNWLWLITSPANWLNEVSRMSRMPQTSQTQTSETSQNDVFDENSLPFQDFFKTVIDSCIIILLHESSSQATTFVLSPKIFEPLDQKLWSCDYTSRTINEIKTYVLSCSQKFQY